MGLDADLCKYKISNVSEIDREHYINWRSHYYSYILNEDDEKWNNFETEVFYTDDYVLNSILLNAISETTGDDYSEDGASLVNTDTLKLAIDKLKNTINDGHYAEYNDLNKDYYKKELNELINLLENESVDLSNGEFTYLYQATY